MKKTRVLFVCLGNICRSPIAALLFASKAKRWQLDDRLEWDSAGISDFHVGEFPDPRMREVAAQHRMELKSKARQVTEEDFKTFDFIIPMDKAVESSLLKMSPPLHERKASIYTLRLFEENPDSDDVPDPYWGEIGDFHRVYRIIDKALNGFVAYLRTNVL